MKNFVRKYYPEMIFAISFLLLLLRGMMSFCWSDESLYFSTAYRFLQGDAPLSTEWYPTQLLSIMILPLVWVKSLFGGMEGVILFFRILYVITSTALSYGVFRMLRGLTDRIWALLSALMLLFYAHLNIATFSYYMVSVYAAVLSSLLVVSCLTHPENKKNNIKKLILAGFSFALLVLSMPTMAPVYFGVVALGLIIFRKKALKPIGYSLIGILIPAVPFVIYVLAKARISDIVTALPYILSDEEHASTTLYVAARTCITNLSSNFGLPFRFYLIALGLSVVYLIWSLIGKLADGNERALKLLALITVVLDLASFAGMAFYGLNRTGYILVALTLFALPLYALSNRKNLLLLIPYVLGMIQAYSYTYTSSGSPLYTEAIGFAVAAVPSVIMIGDYAGELARQSVEGKPPYGKISYSSFLAICCMSLFVVIALRITNVYRDDALKNLTVRIEEGPAKGLYTSEKHLEDYQMVMDSMREVNALADSDPEKYSYLLISKLLPFGYMCTDLSCAGPSSWRSRLDSQWLISYYEMHPEALPDLVFVLDEQFGRYETCGDVEADPAPNENSMGEYMEAYLNESDFAVRRLPAGELYYLR